MLTHKWIEQFAVFKYCSFFTGSTDIWLFLSLGFIGYASVFHEVVANHAIDDVEDDQLYYTKIFLDEQKRVSLVF